MGDYLPDQPTIDINAVIYQYTVEKETTAPFVVHIQNKDTQSNGYIFRETDDWSGLPPATINKYIPVPNLPSSRFGEGSIETEGEGEVTEHSVMYSYRIDMSEITPELPQVEIPEVQIDVYNALEDDAVSSSEAEVATVEEDEEEDTSKEKEREERALRASKAAIGIGTSVAQQMMLSELTKFTLESYVAATIDGGTYPETQDLRDSKLPESRRGLRNGLAQQILHTEMVDSQYR